MYGCKNCLASGGGALSMDSLIPRTDITKLLTEKLLKKLSDGDAKKWKDRKEAMDEISDILKSNNHHVKGDLGALVSELKGRMADSNKILVQQAIALVATLAHDAGPDFTKHAKTVLPPILT